MKSNSNYYDKELSRKLILFISYFISYFNNRFKINIVFDANNENIVIGKMVVTVEMIDALNAIKRELNLDRNELTSSF